MDFQHVEVSTRDRVAFLTLNRPDRRNALASQTVRELSAALTQAETAGEVGAVVLTGAGDRAFCAGGDLTAGMDEGLLAAHEGRRAFGALLVQLHRLEKPVIARVNGYALGGGLGLVAACHLAVAVDDARFGTPEIDLGLFPWMIAALLHRSLPPKALHELILTGEKIDAARALELGLLNRVVPRAGLDAAVLELAGRVAGKSPAVVRLGLRSLAVLEDQPLEKAVEYLAGQLSLNVLTEDAVEGVSAFMEKRPPHWKGR